MLGLFIRIGIGELTDMSEEKIRIKNWRICVDWGDDDESLY